MRSYTAQAHTRKLTRTCLYAPNPPALPASKHADVARMHSQTHAHLPACAHPPPCTTRIQTCRHGTHALANSHAPACMHTPTPLHYPHPNMQTWHACARVSSQTRACTLTQALTNTQTSAQAHLYLSRHHTRTSSAQTHAAHLVIALQGLHHTAALLSVAGHLRRADSARVSGCATHGKADMRQGARGMP